MPGSNARPITADITLPDAEWKDLILFVHGFKGFKDWGAHNLVAKTFARAGIAYLKFNFSHNGTNPDDPSDITDMETFGENTFSKEFEDLDRVIGFALSEQFFASPGRLSLIGHSRAGGTCVVQAAKDDRISKLVTWAGVNDFAGIWKKEQEAEWREKGVIYNFNARTKQYTPLKLSLLEDLEQHREEYDILAAAERVKQPWLIIHGTEDINVSPDTARKFHELQPDSELQFIEGTDHVFGASHPWTRDELPTPLAEVCNKTIEFLK